MRSPGKTKGVKTTRPSRRASPSPPYTSFSTVTSKLFTMRSTPVLYHENTSLFRNAALRKFAHRKLPRRPEELGADPARLRVHFLHRGPARDHRLPAARGASRQN